MHIKVAENADIPAFTVADAETDAVHVSCRDIKFSGLARCAMQLEAAIERIGPGEFGYCVQCGDAINRKSLEIDLAATR